MVGMDKRISPVYKNKMDFVEDNISVGDGRVLDIGCGEGHYFNIFKRNGLSFVGVDVDSSVLPFGEGVLCGDAEALPFSDSSFDTVVCVDVLEHVASDWRALREICRVLRPGGKLVGSVPNLSFPFSYDPVNRFLSFFGVRLPIGLWAWGHRRLYSERVLRKRLSAARFDFVKFERRSFFLVGLFVNYLPFFAQYLVVPFLKRFGFSRGARFRTSPDLKKGWLFKFYNFVNRVDRRFFSASLSSVNLCFVVRKG